MILMLIAWLLGPHDAFSDCAQCHVATNWRELRTSADGFDHDATGFPLRGAHRARACSACHGETPLQGSACAGCHADPHRGENGARCDGCHGPETWAIPEMQTRHARTRLPLVGRHAGLPCVDCHPRAIDDRWISPPARCDACHLSDATAPGVHPDHRRAGFARECDACHTPYGWAPATVVHDRFWPLTGAHRAAECARCHPGGRYAGTPRDCAECHRDDFARGHAPGDSRDCASCHRTSAWTPADFPDHDRLFPLPHEGVRECASCHPQGTSSLSCFTCHEHNRDRMNREHDDVRGYAFEARACYRCHPRGDD